MELWSGSSQFSYEIGLNRFEYALILIKDDILVELASLTQNTHNTVNSNNYGLEYVNDNPNRKTKLTLIG